MTKTMHAARVPPVWLVGLVLLGGLGLFHGAAAANEKEFRSNRLFLGLVRDHPVTHLLGYDLGSRGHVPVRADNRYDSDRLLALQRIARDCRITVQGRSDR